MDNETLLIAHNFLSSALNKKTYALQSQNLPSFIALFSQLLQHHNLNLKVKIEIFGKNCLFCGKYIAKSDLSQAVALNCNDLEHYFCGHECIRRHALLCTNNTLLDIEYVRCPECRNSIPYEILNEAFNGRIKDIQNDACDRALNSLLDDEAKALLSPKFTCQVCYTEVKIEDGITLDCDHRFCTNCIKMHIEMLIESAQVSDEKLKCPACTQPLNVYEIEDAVGPEIYQKYEKFLLRGLQLSEIDNDSIIFHCPGADCEYICIVEKGEKEYECPQCKFKCCPMCKDDVHKDLTCEEFKEWKIENSDADRLFNELIEQEGLLRCPQCGAAVQRISGCKFMVCTSPQCQGRTYFCYDCGIKLKGDHAAHTCRKRLKKRKKAVKKAPVRTEPPALRRGRRKK
ncbi:unnamed protein product [Blepharisma stoltei]|uniref:RBR-type E3 ubiquitin transferase n=1 Tax=Blepharisma stoltei TaxID=1481888 RepID=A0AAU9JEY2_9CILI|nr:unnamed protein product [Blepharisma stoltei]